MKLFLAAAAAVALSGYASGALAESVQLNIYKVDIYTGAAAAGRAADSDMYIGDQYRGNATNNPNSNMLQHAYNAPNYCPAGLQPVLVGGVVCCGNANAGAYVDRPGKVARRPAPRAYAPVGVKGVAIPGEKGVVYR
ncbi:hypothetical protein [Sagittula sp. S175]|uniref:hypothetical protein n=1 Tax=Sagittula sp. S175 TaxID=3415129 RepID=UPI003C7B4BD0